MTRTRHPLNEERIQEILDWVKENAVVSVEKDDLVVGKYGRYAFRIFIDESFMGVIESGVGTWSQARCFYDLASFLSFITKEKS